MTVHHPHATSPMNSDSDSSCSGSADVVPTKHLGSDASPLPRWQDGRRAARCDNIEPN